MVKRYDKQTFGCTIKGEAVEFYCYTTDTRNGFCHTCVCRTHDMTNTKIGYINRTWERFTYESVLSKAIEKLPKHLQGVVKAVLIDRKAQEEHDKCMAFVSAFEGMYNALNKENKEALANSGIEMHTEADAHAVMGLMGMMALTQEK